MVVRLGGNHCRHQGFERRDQRAKVQKMGTCTFKTQSILRIYIIYFAFVDEAGWRGVWKSDGVDAGLRDCDAGSDSRVLHSAIRKSAS